MKILNLISQIGVPFAVLIGSWLHGKISRKPSELERARLLSHLADEAAAVILRANPAAPWGDLVKLVTSTLAAVAGVPTSNVAVLERAAQASLARAGVAAP